MVDSSPSTTNRRNRQSFARLEQDLKQFGTELNIGTLTAVSVIDWFLFRAEKIGLELAKEFPNLTAWAAEMNEKYEVLRETKANFVTIFWRYEIGLNNLISLFFLLPNLPSPLC